MVERLRRDRRLSPALLRALALKPAPVQAHWLGFGATVGGNYIDYLITDEGCTPDDLRPYCAESVVMLPHSFMPVAPSSPMPVRIAAVALLPA